MTTDLVLFPGVSDILPIDWQLVRLSEVVHVKGGKRLPKGADFAIVPTKHPYIRIVDFTDGTVSTNDLRYLTLEVQKQIERYTISKDDIYISIAGTIGLVGIIPENLDGANLTENAAKLIIRNKQALDKSFLSFFLSSPYGKEQVENLTAKTSQPKLALVRQYLRQN